MQHLIKFSLRAGMCILLASANPSHASEREIKQISKELQHSLNNRDTSNWNGLMAKEVSTSFEDQYQRFIQRFPNATWSIKPGGKLKDNRDFLELYITAEKDIAGKKYSLKAEQKIAITHQNLKVLKKEILSEYSILNNTHNPIEIRLNIPDTVLTGAKYDIDIILEKPLKDSIIAGGIIPINSRNKNIDLDPSMQLAPMGAGGLFKSTQAPLIPGQQRWAALIAHPNGLVSITKMVRVVSNQNQLRNE